MHIVYCGHKIETEVLQAIYNSNAVYKEKKNRIRKYNDTEKGESKKHGEKHIGSC